MAVIAKSDPRALSMETCSSTSASISLYRLEAQATCKLNKKTGLGGWICCQRGNHPVISGRERGRVDEQRQSENLRSIKGIEFG